MPLNADTSTKSTVEMQLSKMARMLLVQSRQRITQLLKNSSQEEVKQQAWLHLRGALHRTFGDAPNLEEVLAETEKELDKMIAEIMLKNKAK